MKVLPNPNDLYPIEGYTEEIFVKPSITNPKIKVGDFTYIADNDFEKHVTHFYEWTKQELIIGKFCQIAKGVEFMMNDANHQMSSISTYPFFTIKGFDANAPKPEDMPLKGNTIIGNDVWIGQNVTILPGVKIGDGVIIGANSVVSKDVEPYSIVAGNPIRTIRKRFDDELIDLLLKFKWWYKNVEEINELIPLLTNSDLTYVKEEIRRAINEEN